MNQTGRDVWTSEFIDALYTISIHNMSLDVCEQINEQ